MSESGTPAASGGAAGAAAGTDAGATAAASSTSDFTPFYANLSEENRQVFAARKFDPAKTGPNDLLDTIRNQDKLIGKNNLEPPNLADDRALAAWPGWKALGVPENQDGYKFKDRKEYKLPDDLPWDEEGEKTLRAALFKAKVPAKFAPVVADELVNLQIARAAQFRQALNDQAAQLQTKLRGEWGGKFDSRMEAMKTAASALAEKAGVKLEAPQLADRMSVLFGDEGALRVLDYLAQNLGEDVIGPAHGGAGGDTPAAARAELERLATDEEFQKALNSREHVGHKDALARWQRLNQQAYPGNVK